MIDKMATVAETVGHVNLNGWGESLLNPHFLPLLRRLDARGVYYGFSTNGSLVDRKIAEELADLNYLQRLNVSIDSPDPQVYQSLRCGPLKPVLKGVQYLTQSLRNLERLTVSSVLMAENLDSLSQFPPLLARLGVQGWVLQDLLDPLDSSGLGRFPEGLGTRYIVETLQDDCRKLGISVLIMPNLSRRLRGKGPSIWAETPASLKCVVERSQIPESRQCANPWEHVFVNRHGQVLPCPCCPPWEERATDGQNVMGDLHEQTFREIWNGDKFRAFRSALLEGRPPSMCRMCPLASTGPHFFRLFAARLVSIESPASSNRVRLVIENRGFATWTPKTPIHVGVIRPGGTRSPLYDDSWLCADRAGAVRTDEVAPGDTTSIEFKIAPGLEPLEDRFQLVAEGVCWMPNTRFRVRTGSRPRIMIGDADEPPNRLQTHSREISSRASY